MEREGVRGECALWHSPRRLYAAFDARKRPCSSGFARRLQAIAVARRAKRDLIPTRESGSVPRLRSAIASNRCRSSRLARPPFRRAKAAYPVRNTRCQIQRNGDAAEPLLPSSRKRGAISLRGAVWVRPSSAKEKKSANPCNSCKKGLANRRRLCYNVNRLRTCVLWFLVLC